MVGTSLSRRQSSTTALVGQREAVCNSGSRSEALDASLSWRQNKRVESLPSRLTRGSVGSERRRQSSAPSQRAVQAANARRRTLPVNVCAHALSRTHRSSRIVKRVNSGAARSALTSLTVSTAHGGAA